MDKEHTAPRVFLFPWLAYGHISPFLELAKKLSERGFFLFLCSTPVNLKSIEKKITKNLSLQIQLVELHLPSLPELPPQHHTTNGLPLHLIVPLREALKMARPSLSNILKALNPDWIIHDATVPWMPAMASGLNIPTVRLISFSAAMCSYCSHVAQRPGSQFPFPALQLREFEKANLHRFIARLIDQREPEDEVVIFPRRLSNFSLIKSSREIEGKYIDYLSDLIDTKIIAVGPLVQDPVFDHDQDDHTIELIEWLGKKSEYSTVFISFGSECFLNKEEIEEIAFGLELSQVNFVWVIRLPEGENTTVEKALPEGFVGRIGDRGRVVEGWAPQAKILSHQSIGGFVSHCGWNSTLESLEFGIPLIAMPMHWDQPVTAKLMVEVGVAVEVMRDDNGKFQREEIAKVIKDVIVGNMAEQVRKQVRSMRQKVKMREKEDMDEAYQVLAQICEK